MKKLSSGITELSLDEVKNVSGGHNPTPRQMQADKHGGVSPSQGHGHGLDNVELPGVTVHGGHGQGGING